MDRRSQDREVLGVLHELGDAIVQVDLRPGDYTEAIPTNVDRIVTV